MTDQCIDARQSVYAIPDVKTGTQKEFRVLIWMSVCFLIFHFIRCFGNDFWSDDAFTANVVKHSFSEIVDIASTDSHSPLYYFIVKVFCEIFGYSDWTYQFTSYIPYLVLMVLTLTLVRKWFGIQTSILLSVMLSVMPVSINYITEVRMYEWALMFVFIMTLAAYAFCQKPNIVSALIMAASGLLASYMHMYSMIAVGAIFLAVIVIMYIRRKLVIVLAFAIAVAIAVIPLMKKALNVFDAVNDNFWIERPPYIVEWIGYSFGDVWLVIPGIIGFAAIITVILYEFGKEKGPLAKYLEPKETGHFTQIGCISILALAPFLFTNLFGIIGSYIIGPVYALKYGFSTLAGLWLLMGVTISRFVPDFKALKKFLIILLVFAIPVSCYNLGCEAVQCYETAQLIDDTGDLGDAFAITDTRQITYSVLEFYYPGIECVYVEDGNYADHINTSKDNWLFLEDKITDEQRSQFEAKGYRVDTVRTDTYLAHYEMNVYQIVPM